MALGLILAGSSRLMTSIEAELSSVKREQESLVVDIDIAEKLLLRGAMMMKVVSMNRWRSDLQ